jgi:hypothetical protein
VSYIRKSRTKVLAAAISIISIAAIAIWQFRLFVTHTGPQGVFDAQGGTHHLWWAVGAGLVACVAGFLVLSVFVRYDKGDEMHVTS